MKFIAFLRLNNKMIASVSLKNIFLIEKLFICKKYVYIENVYKYMHNKHCYNKQNTNNK